MRGCSPHYASNRKDGLFILQHTHFIEPSQFSFLQDAAGTIHSYINYSEINVLMKRQDYLGQFLTFPNDLHFLYHTVIYATIMNLTFLLKNTMYKHIDMYSTLHVIKLSTNDAKNVNIFSHSDFKKVNHLKFCSLFFPRNNCTNTYIPHNLSISKTSEIFWKKSLNIKKSGYKFKVDWLKKADIILILSWHFFKQSYFYALQPINMNQWHLF